MRPCLQTVIRRPNGEPDPGADLELLIRSTAIQWPVYAAASGGSPITQPFSPDADGNVTVFATQNLQYDLKISYSDGTVSTRPIDLTFAGSDAWTAPTLTAPWTNGGGGYVGAGYTIDGLGFVHLRGMIQGGPGNVFVLPSGYRPAARVGFSIASFGAVARLLVTAGGQVSIANGAALWDMQGVSFPT